MAYDPHADVKSAVAVSDHVLAASDDRFVKIDRTVLLKLEQAARRMLTHEDALLDIQSCCTMEARADYAYDVGGLAKAACSLIFEAHRQRATKAKS